MLILVHTLCIRLKSTINYNDQAHELFVLSQK